jgi:hypothetical protein
LKKGERTAENRLLQKIIGRWLQISNGFEKKVLSPIE